MKRRKRIRVEEEVRIRWHEDGQDKERFETQVRYVKPPIIPSVPPRKLQFSMVPVALWKRNLRAFIKKSQWDNLREAIITIRMAKCEVCGVIEDEGLHAHEEWLYDTDGVPGIARLVGIGIQCKRCHQIEHYGVTQMLHMQGHISDEELEEIHQHYCSVNQVTEQVMRLDHESERARWEALNQYPWEVEWGVFGVMMGKRLEANDFNFKILSKYGDMSAEPVNDYHPPHVGLLRPFGTRAARHWAVPLVEPTATKRIKDDCIVVGYVFVTRGAVPSDIQSHARDLIGKTYKDWTTLPENPELFDFTPHS